MSKKPKDTNAPKKSQSSYFLFSNERRPILQSENKDKKITEISKLISSEWKEISPTEKTKYEERAKELKKEYLLTFEEYKKTDNYRIYQEKLARWKENQKDNKSGFTVKGKKGKGPKKPKQPAAMPKRPQSSYFVFSNKRRKELQEQYPNKKITELSKLISTEWNAFNDDDKKKYEEQAKINKERYNKEIAVYKETDEYSKYMVILNAYKVEKKQWDKNDGMDIDDDGEQITIKLPRKPKDKNCPKRGLTSYFIFAKEVREKTKAEFPTKQITDLAKEISKKWKVLSDEEKIPYNEEAARLKEASNKAMEAYKDSDQAKEHEVRLEKWKEECDKRKRDARTKQAAKKKPKQASPKRKTRKKKEKMQESSDDDSSSESSSDSDSDSDSDSSSDSDSDSDSSSESSSE